MGIFDGAALGGAGLGADLLERRERRRRRVPEPLEGGVGDVGEAVLEPVLVELGLAAHRQPRAGAARPTAYTSHAARSARVSSHRRAARRRTRVRAGPGRAASRSSGRGGPGRRENVRGRRLSSKFAPEIQSTTAAVDDVGHVTRPAARTAPRRRRPGCRRCGRARSAPRRPRRWPRSRPRRRRSA